MNRFSWIVAICCTAFWLGISLWAVPWAISTWWPKDYFESVYKIFIDNARVGQPIEMVVDRRRHREFRGSWDVYVRKQRDNGFYLFCHTGDNDWPFEQDSQLPDPLDLNFWMGIPPNQPCPKFTEGVYYVITEWSVPWYLGSTIRWSMDSNTFKVIPEEYPIPLSGELMEDNGESDEKPQDGPDRAPNRAQ